MCFKISIKQLLLNPEKFLESKTAKIKNMLGFITMLSVLPAALFTIALYAYQEYMVNAIQYMTAVPVISLPIINMLGLTGGIYLYILLFVGIVVGAALSLLVGGVIFHVFAKMLGGKKRYVDTLHALTASMAPMLLLGWIPIVSVLASIQSLVVLVDGIGKKQNLSVFKSVMTVALPVIILMIISLILAIVMAEEFLGLPTILPLPFGMG